MANKRIPELDPVVTAAQSDKFIVRQSGDVEDKHVDMDVMQLALLITESQITDLQSYLLVEANDLTAAVVWADIPDANVPESAVTQHEAALSITESQISDLQAYLLAELNDLTAAVVWADIPDTNVPESAVTQHEAALSITESQISDLAHTVGVSGLGIWKYRTETGTPPASGQIRFNNANISLATEFFLSETNEGGVDVSTFLELLLQDGSALFIQDQTNAANFVLIEISSSVDNGTFRTYGIQSIIEEGTEPSQNANVILITTGLASAGAVVEVNDLTAAVVWANIPDVNVPESAVTQHEAALAITESQIADGTILARVGSAETITSAWTFEGDITLDDGASLNASSGVANEQFSLAQCDDISEIQFGSAVIKFAIGIGSDVPTEFGGPLILGGDLDTNGFNIANLDTTLPDLSITAGTIVAADGGDLSLKSGDGALGFAGGDTILTVGVGASNGASGNLFLNTTTGIGAAGGLQVGGTPGLVSIYGIGRSGDGQAGNLELWGGYASGAGGGSDGGDLILWGGGQGGGSGFGGDALLIGGESDTQPGAAKVIGGQATVGGPGGEARVAGGAGFGTNFSGGLVRVDGGAGVGTGNGGQANLIGGISGSGATGTGGNAEVVGGASAATNGDGGDVVLSSGAGAGSGDRGDVRLQVGGTDIVYDEATDRLIQGAEIFAYQSELFSAELNDLTAAVVWANVPDGNITESSVTQHEAALTILESQITDGTIYTRRAGAETISNNWNWLDNAGLNFGTGNDWSFLFNGGDLQLISSPAASSFQIFQGGGLKWELDHGNDRMWLRDGYVFRISSSDDTDFAEFSHDLTDFATAFTTTVDWNITGLSGRIKQGAETLAFLSEIPAAGLADVVDDTSPQLGGNLASNGFDINFADSDKAFFGTVGQFSISNVSSVASLNSADGDVVSFEEVGVRRFSLDYFNEIVQVHDGYVFRIADADDTDFVDMSHAGAGGDFAFAFTNTVDWDITGLSGRIKQGAETLAFLSELPAVAVENDVVQARRTTDLLLTTSYVDVTLDTTDVESDATEIEHDVVTDRIVVKTTGLYEIGYEVDVETTETSGSLLITADGRVRVNDTGVDVPGSIAQQGSARDTSLDGEHFNCHLSNSFFVNLTANDFVTLQLRKTELSGAGSGDFDAVRTTLKVKRLN